jgi:hypothetical protein
MSFFQLPEQTLELILPIQAKQITNRKFISKKKGLPISMNK